MRFNKIIKKTHSICTFQIFLKVAEETGVDADPERGGEEEPPEDRDTGKLKPFLFAQIVLSDVAQVRIKEQHPSFSSSQCTARQLV